MSFDPTSKLFEDVAHIRETLAANTAILQVNTDQLKEHIRRTEALEEKVELDRTEMSAKIEEALLPIRTARALGRLSAGLAALSTLFVLIYKFIMLFAR